MRKFITVFCIIALLLSFSGCKRNYTHSVYEVTITDSLISNNSVGRDWKQEYFCENKTVVSGQRWTVPIDTTKTIKITAKITEDDIHKDIGYGYLSVELRDGFKTSTTVTVSEDNGRYTDNSALWEITCKVKLVKNIEQK